MKAEIIAVGSELLIGDVINSNAAWISQQLANLGVDVHYHSTVGDNPARIQGVISQAISRADLLIFTGGLGPTEDDLTVATLAAYFQSPLVSNPESEADLKAFFAARQMAMPLSNLKQVQKPQGATTLKNPVGTAPGIAWDVSGKTGKPTYLLAFPGVPRELYAMWPQAADYILEKRETMGETREILVTRYLHFVGIAEAKLGEELSDLMAASNPSVAPYVGHSEVKVRIAAKASTIELAEAMIAPVKHEILHRLGRFYYGDNDHTLEACVAELLTRQGYSLALAESCTGGLVSSRLTDVPGSSAFTFINMVTYGNAEKIRFVDVLPETLTCYGAVSPQVAIEMAQGIRKNSRCDIGLSITGIAGPEGGSEEKPVGLAYVSLCGMDGKNQHASGSAPGTVVKKVMINPRYSRKDIKYGFSHYALHFLLRYLRGELETDYPELCSAVLNKTF